VVELANPDSGIVVVLVVRNQCSVEATYRIIDVLVIYEDFVRDVLQPAGDCLGFDLPDDE